MTLHIRTTPQDHTMIRDMLVVIGLLTVIVTAMIAIRRAATNVIRYGRDRGWLR